MNRVPATVVTRRCLLPALVLAFLSTACAGGPAHRGDQALEAGRPDEAVRAYEAALAEDPGNPQLIGRLAEARERLAERHLEAGREALAAGDAVAAYEAFAAALEARPAHAAAREGQAEAQVRVLEAVRGHLSEGAWGPALELISRSVRAGLPEAEVASLRTEARQGMGQDACESGLRFADRDLPGNALLAFLRAAELDGRHCRAKERAQAARDDLRQDLRLRLELDVQGASETLGQPTRSWAERAGVPLEVVGPGRGGAGPPLRLAGQLTVETDRQETPRAFTVERQVGTRTVANPEYASLRRQLQQLASEIENVRNSLNSQAREVDYLYRVYVNSGSPAVGEQLRLAVQRLEDLKRRYNDLAQAYNESRVKLADMDQLVQEPVVEERQVDAVEVRMAAQARGEARLVAPWLDAPRVIPLDYDVGAQDYSWPTQSEDIPENPVELPDAGQLVRHLELGLGERLLDALQDVLGSRADRLVEDGTAARERGDVEGAVERFVRALLIAPAVDRAEVRRWLAEVRGASLPEPDESPASATASRSPADS